MRYRFKIALALLSMNSFTTYSATNDGPVTEELLVKDVKVILRSNPASEIVSVQLYWQGGALNVTEETQGIEPFLFNSAQLDAKKYFKKNWNKLLQGTGSELGTQASRNFTVVNLRCIRKDFDGLWEIFTNYIIKSSFNDERTEVARQQMLAQIRTRKDAPDVYIRDLAEQQFYQGHAYQMSPSGTEESIKKITMKQMNSHRKDHLKKNRLLLVVVGNVDKEDLRKKVSNTFGKLSKSKDPLEFPEMVRLTRANLKIEERDLPTNYILGLFAAPSLRDPDYYPTAIAVDILKWRLFEEIRTKRNLSYAPDAFLAANFANYGGIYATTDKPDSTAKVMLTEVKKLRREPVPEKIVRDRINMYITKYYLDNQSGVAQSRFLAQLELAGAGWQESEQIVEKLRRVTAEDVHRVANEYFKNFQFVYLGNPELIKEEVFTGL